MNGETSSPKNHVDNLKILFVGMTFGTMEKARSYYEDYGRQ